MKLGFIGAGNMAGAILQGALAQKVLGAADVHIFDVNRARMEQLRADFGVLMHDRCEDLIAACDVLLLAVKPNVVAKVLSQNRAALSGKALISIAAGWTVGMLKAELDAGTRLLRVMPNTPALVGCGMTAFSKSHTLSEVEARFAEDLFRALGRLSWVEEYQMEAVIGVSGSGPAYAYLFIEAMADGGVACGLPRAQALEFAAQTLLGSAKMALESGKHPGELKDMVCSPAGTTIEAVRSLERDGFRGAVLEAVLAACDKAREMQN